MSRTNQGFKTCRKCDFNKSINDFPPKRNICKTCLAKKTSSKQTILVMPTPKKKYKYDPSSEKREARRLKFKEQRLLDKYNLTLADFLNLVEKQKGNCAICGKHFGEALVVDHDHNTGKIRKLLCSHCNSALGFIKDNPETAFGLAIYLLHHV